MAVEPRLASAVMLLRDTTSGQGIEVFMVRRVIQSDFMPDVYVFLGGSVSKDDRAAEIRELFEEDGILLAYKVEKLLAIPEQEVERFDAYRKAFNERKGSLVEMAHTEHSTLATDLLNYFADWITPV